MAIASSRCNLGIVAALLVGSFATSTVEAQFNPNGFIRTDGWNFLGPFTHPYSAGGGGVTNMLRNWVCPHNIALEDPKGNNPSLTQWADIDFGGCAASAGYNLGGLNPNPVWFTIPFLEAVFGLAPGTFPRQDRIDYGESDSAASGIIPIVNTMIIPNVAGATPVPVNDIMMIATTYVRNDGAPRLVDMCTGSDDSIQVWFNNNLVLNKSIPRGYGGGCQEVTPALLPSGITKIAVLIWEGGGGHNFGLGIGLPGTGLNLADGNAEGIVFLGPGAPTPPANDFRGQIQYALTRSVNAKPLSCPFGPNETVNVTIDGTPPPGGAGDPVITVTEDILPPNPAALTISNVSNSGAVADKFPPSQTCAPTVITELTEHIFIGTDVGAASGTTNNGDGTYTSVSTSNGDVWADCDDFEFQYDEVTGDFDISCELLEETHSNGTVNGGGDTGIGRWGKYGLMAREALTRNSARFTATQNHLPDLQDVSRQAGRLGAAGADGCDSMYEDGSPIFRPTLHRLTRRGNIFQGWVSDQAGLRNGTLDPCQDANWQRMGRADNWGAAPASVFVGFANSEHNSGPAATQTVRFKLLAHVVQPPQLLGKTITWTVPQSTVDAGLTYSLQYGETGTVRFDGSSLPLAFTGGASSVSILPLSGPVGIFDNSHDIGGPPSQGSTVYNPPGGAGVTPDSYVVSGSGGDIWDGGDQMQFAYKLVTGDFVATARVTEALNPPNARWGRYGIMARYTCDFDSKYSLACFTYRGEDPNVGGTHATPGQDTHRHQSRRDHLNGGGTSRDQQVLAANDMATLVPQNLGWVRLTRRGSYFYTQFSADDDGQAAEWVFAGGDTHENAPETLLVGLISSSHNTAGANQLVVTYDNVSIGTPGPLPSVPCNPGDVIVDKDFDGTDGGAGLGGPDSVVNVGGGAFTPAEVGDKLRLTQDGTGDSAVSVYFDTTGANLGDIAFRADFDVFIGAAGTPADGMTFSVVNDSFANATGHVGDGGGGAGYNAGDHNLIPTDARRRRGFAVEIDNWDGGHGDNDPPGGHGANAGNPAFYHVGLNFNNDMQSAQNNVERGVVLPPLFNNPDGIHLTVTYTPSTDDSGTSKIEVLVAANGGAGGDGIVVLSAVGPRLVGDCYLGFTAGTGGAFANHEADNLRVTECTKAPPGVGPFLRGDTDNSGGHNITDGVRIFNYLFTGGPAPPCLASANTNGAGLPNITSGVYVLNWLFLGGPAPPPPAFPTCGTSSEPEDVALGCATPLACP